MNVKVKRLHPDAVIPAYSRPGDAGLDLTAVSLTYDDAGNAVYGTGLAFEIPDGYVGLVFPRSSIAARDIALTNCVGVIDSGYRGEVTAKFKPSIVFDPDEIVGLGGGRPYAVGERIAQLIIMPYPRVTLTEADTLGDTERGAGGYGSTGR